MIGKKDIIDIADTIRKIVAGTGVPSRSRVITHFADLLARNNPRFNRQLFLDYVEGKCGPNGGKKK